MEPNVLIRCPALFDINAGPEEFIPVAEKSNLISKLDMWVISYRYQRCYQRALRNSRIQRHPLYKYICNGALQSQLC